MAMLDELPVNLPLIEDVDVGPSAGTTPGERNVVVIPAGQAVWRVPLRPGQLVSVPTITPTAFALASDAVRQRVAISGRQGSLEVTAFTSGVPGPPRRLSLPAGLKGRSTLPCWMPTGELVVAVSTGQLVAFSPDLDRPRHFGELAEPIHAVAAAPAGPPRVATAGSQSAIVPLAAAALGTARMQLLDVGEDSSRVAWSPDAGTVAIGTRTGRVLLFDAATGAARGSLAAHESQIEALVFSNDGRVLLSADLGCVRISDFATLTTFDELRPEWNVRRMHLSSDDRQLIIVGGSDPSTPPPTGRIAILDFDRREALAP